MRSSIRFKLFITMSSLIALFVVLSWLANTLLLQKYYNHNKKVSLVKTFEQTQNLLKGNHEDINLEIEKLENLKSIRVVIWDKDFNIVYDSVQRETSPKIRPLDRNFQFHNPQELILLQKLPELKNGARIIEERWDGRLNTYFISFMSVIDKDKFIFISSPIAAIQESAEIANKFFVIIGLMTLFIGSIIIFLISSNSTKPILELDEIAKRMAKLDFSKKYTIHSQDEIGTLGQSINSLSEQLEKSISNLQNANEKLTEDIKKERKIDEMRKEFISNVSHELKTPIALIQGYSEGLQLNVNEDEENKNYYCEVIIDEAQKMDKLVKNLLNLSQIEAGYVELDISDFDISETIETIVKRNSILLKDKAIEVILDLDTHIPVKGDFAKIEQVLLNYFNNAINHLENDKVIKISHRKIEHKSRISVFNSGNHIPEESLTKIWISFYKVDKARTRDYGGTGLGLSVVKAILDAHHNNYGVNNVEGGVEFWFEVDAV